MIQCGLFHPVVSPATCDDSDGGCELEEIQKELEQLRSEKEKLEKQGHSLSIRANGGMFPLQAFFLLT